MKRFAVSLILACALSSVALAGDIPSTGIVAEEPPPDAITSSVPTSDVPLESELTLEVLLAILNVF